jgi:hypothetical protein
MEKCKIILNMCTFLRDVPNGLAFMKYKHPLSQFFSFEGMGVFTDGKLHMGPFLAIRGDGYGVSCS